MMLIPLSVNFDWLFNTPSRVLQADWFLLEINEKATLNINMPYWFEELNFLYWPWHKLRCVCAMFSYISHNSTLKIHLHGYFVDVANDAIIFFNSLFSNMFIAFFCCRYHLQEYISRVSLTSTKKAMKVVNFCDQHGFTQQGNIILDFAWELLLIEFFFNLSRYNFRGCFSYWDQKHE